MRKLRANTGSSLPRARGQTFTLVELLVSMAVFTLIMLSLVSFFNSAQKLWINSMRKNEAYENARVAMDMITRDLQCAYYQYEKIPFWHKSKDGSLTTDDNDDNYGRDNEMLAFVCGTSSYANTDYQQSKFCEVKYQLFSTDNPDDTYAGFLRRSITPDKTSGTAAGQTNKKWNYYNDFDVAKLGTGDPPDQSFTADAVSSEAFQKIIPYVTSLDFTCYEKKSDGALSEISPAAATHTAFPYMVEIKFSLLDETSWLKWTALGGKPHHPIWAPGSEPAVAKNFREKNELTFKKTVFLGDRGQYLF